MKSKYEKNPDEKLNNICVWYHCECQKAQLPHYKKDKCDGYNHPDCFAYISAAELDRRDKARKLEDSLK